MVGDIIIWRSADSGHTAVVVSEEDDASVLYNQNNIPWISGVTGVVATDEKRVYGQDKKTSIKKSSNPFRIYALNSE